MAAVCIAAVWIGMLVCIAGMKRTAKEQLRGRKRLTSDDVVPICKALGVTPNELFGINAGNTPEKSA